MARKAKAIEPVRGLFPRGGKWWCRVRAPGLEPVQRSTGAPLEDVQRANDVMAMLELLKRQQHFDLLEAAAVNKITLEELYARHIHNRLEDARATVNDVDVEPWVAKWEAHMKRAQAPAPGTIDCYVYGLRLLMPEGEPFYVSQLTEKDCDEWLNGLADDGLTPSTRRRHGAALKVFCKWLKKQGVLKSSPLREWELPTNNPPRQVWWNFETLTKIIDAMPDGDAGSREQQEKMAIILMAGSGMELSACLKTQGRDVNRKQHTVFARGTKNNWRTRTVHVRKWAWAKFEPYAKNFLHNALLFELVQPDTLRDHFYDAQMVHGMATKQYLPERGRVTLRTAEHTIHDLRHTFCYLAFTGEDGDAKKGLHYCKRQLGHKDLVMGQRIYANFNLSDELMIDESDDTLQETGT